MEKETSDKSGLPSQQRRYSMCRPQLARLDPAWAGHGHKKRWEISQPKGQATGWLDKIGTTQPPTGSGESYSVLCERTLAIMAEGAQMKLRRICRCVHNCRGRVKKELRTI